MKFLLAIGLLLTAFSLFLVHQTRQTGYAHLQQIIRQQTELASTFDIAVKQSIERAIKRTQSGECQIDSIDADSCSTRIAENVFDQVRRQYPHEIIFAKGPVLDEMWSSMDSESAQISTIFQQDPSMDSMSAQILINGQICSAKFMAIRDDAQEIVDLQMIAMPMTGFSSRIDEQTFGRLSILMFGLLGLLAAVYASFQLVAGRHLKRFARHLKAAAEQSDEFHFEPLEIHTNDEVGLMADRYNQLGRTLEQMYRTLESQVRNRTFELQQANESLRHKINECRYAEEQAHVLAHEAMAANRAKSEFLANMSHELRTPMNAIVGFSEVLSETPLQEEQRAFVKMISDSSASLLELITDLLDFSMIEADQLTIEPKNFKIGELLSEIESSMRPAAIQKGIRFEVLQCDLIQEVLQSDPVRLRQCLMNLISNAIKFTQKGYVYINVLLEDIDGRKFLRFDVEDTGIGIAADKLDCIFDSFTQADGAMNRQYGGTGLGLAITKKLSEMIGGHLSVRSQEGVGSTFTICIPAAIQPSEIWNKYKQIDELNDELEYFQLSGEKGTAMNNGKILVAEDNPSNQKLMTILLQKMGVEVTIAEDGQKAVEKCQDETYDMILMDMQMPNVNGYEATRQLRSQGLKTPIIAVTANAMMGDEEKCLEAGCDGYISKPIDRVKLAEVINSHLSAQVG